MAKSIMGTGDASHQLEPELFHVCLLDEELGTRFETAATVPHGRGPRVQRVPLTRVRDGVSRAWRTRRHQLRIETSSFLEILGGAHRVAKVLPGDAPVVVGVRVPNSRLDRAVELRGRLPIRLSCK